MAATALTGVGNLTTYSNGNNASVTLSKPANIANGDWLLAFVFMRTGSGSITVPDGTWVLMGVVNSANEMFAVYAKHIPTASAVSETSWTWTNTAGASRACGIMTRVIGANATTFLHAYGALAAYTGTSSVVLPAVTNSAANKTLFAFAVANTTTTGNPPIYTAPAGMTTVAQVTADNGSTASAAIWVGQEVVGSGSTGTRTPTLSPAAANSGGLMFTVNAANNPPTVAAIADQTKAAGATATVTAVPTDPDGTVTAHLWTVDKAPYGTTPPALTNATTTTVTTGPLQVGTTILKYIATDNSGLQSAPAYARLLVQASSTVPVRASRVKTNGGGWTYGGVATDLVDGVSAAGKWIVSPSSPTGNEITFEMEVPSTGTHTISFFADWVENDGTTAANGVLGSFTAQAFRNGVAISDVYSGSNSTNTPVQLTFSMDTDDNAQMNNDLTKIDIKLTASQSTAPVTQVINPSTVAVTVNGTTASVSGSISTNIPVVFDGLNISIAKDEAGFPWVASTAFRNGETVSGSVPLSGAVTLPTGNYVAYVAYSLDNQATWVTGAKTNLTIGAGGSSTGYPAVEIGVYAMRWPNSEGPLSAVPAQCNVVRLAFANGMPLRMTGWGPEGQAASMTSLTALRNRGCKIIVSIGGGGYPVNLSDTTARVADIQFIANELGGIDGVDIDIEASSIVQSQVLAFCAGLKAAFGTNFAITMVPNGGNIDTYLPVGVALHNAGNLTKFGQQFYDVNVPLNAAKSRISQAITEGIPVSKYTVGMMIASDADHWTNAQCLSYMQSIKADWPTIGGAYLWENSRAGTAQWAADMDSVL